MKISEAGIKEDKRKNQVELLTVYPGPGVDVGRALLVMETTCWFG